MDAVKIQICHCGADGDRGACVGQPYLRDGWACRLQYEAFQAGFLANAHGSANDEFVMLAIPAAWTAFAAKRGAQ